MAVDVAHMSGTVQIDEAGLLAGSPASIDPSKSEHEIRIISFRKATKREAQIYFDEIQD